MYQVKILENFSELKNLFYLQEWDFEKNRDSTNRDIEKLRSCIQNLTRSTNPLGKLLDFFQEDIDTIQRELETWKTKNASLNIQIAHEKR